jgi:hypothetical protein
MALMVCDVCQRHVKRAESVCPFCGASMPTGFGPVLGGALVLGIGLAMVSCSTSLYKGPPFAGSTAGFGGHAGTSGAAASGAPAAGNAGAGGAGGRAGAAGNSSGATSGGA